MSTTEIIKEIHRLPYYKRLLVIRKALRSLQESTNKKLEKAASVLLDNYKNDKEFTAFSILDFENFYESR